MSIFGLAKKGFGMLKKKPSSAKKKFDAKRKVFCNAAFQNEIGQTVGKAKKLKKAIQEATARTQRQIDMMKGKNK